MCFDSGLAPFLDVTPSPGRNQFLREVKWSTLAGELDALGVDFSGRYEVRGRPKTITFSPALTAHGPMAALPDY